MGARVRPLVGSIPGPCKYPQLGVYGPKLRTFIGSNGSAQGYLRSSGG